MSFILVTNDDGVRSPALLPFLRALSEVAPVRAVVPDRERSWVGKAITRFDDLRVERGEREGFEVVAVDGYPADCTQLGVHSLFDERPDMVVSGINIGYNHGLAFLLSSGTVGAAAEGWIAGLPALAFSTGVHARGSHAPWSKEAWSQGSGPLWQRASALAADVVRDVRGHGFPAEADLLSVNFPAEASVETPRRVTGLAKVAYDSLFRERLQGRFVHDFRGGFRKAAGLEGTDVGAAREGRVSITPVRLAHEAPIEGALRKALEEVAAAAEEEAMAEQAWRWWKHGVVYQIYPRSYLDASGDGVGDLEGIRQRLDYLAWLGVDALWLSPCFRSPMADFGYDVADYCDIDPLFGTLADMDRLIADAHARGIRIVLDWVPAHTSDQHPWFLESRESRESPKRDWYFWRDPRPDGSYPNNWLSPFGGSVWEWDERTGQYYLHTHLKEQPDLNWRNPEVVRAMHDVLRFWLDRGVDGFRIDVIHRILKDPELRDNPEIPGGLPGYGGQRHLYDENHPDVHEALRGIRGVLDAYTPERMAVGEVFILDPEVAASYLGRGDELHLAFNFSVMRAGWDAEQLREPVEAFERALPPEGWPDVVLSSHDAPRHASRFDHPEQGDRRARTAALLLLTLRGTPFLYYGEELGMRSVPVPEERLQDPLAWTLHPKLSRDPSRTPMPWEGSETGGFTEAGVEPWLPLNADRDVRNVATQREDPSSILQLYRQLLALRRAHPALHAGDYRPLPAPEGVWAFERRAGGSRALCAVNFTSETRRVELEGAAVRAGLRTDPEAALPGTAASLDLAPNEGVALLVE